MRRTSSRSPSAAPRRSASWARSWRSRISEAAQREPAGELVDLADVGYACAYLATPYARRITGGTVYVDGG